jgi:hypothetical protein
MLMSPVSAQVRSLRCQPGPELDLQAASADQAIEIFLLLTETLSGSSASTNLILPSALLERRLAALADEGQEDDQQEGAAERQEARADGALDEHGPAAARDDQ